MLFLILKTWKTPNKVNNTGLFPKYGKNIGSGNPFKKHWSWHSCSHLIYYVMRCCHFKEYWSLDKNRKKLLKPCKTRRILIFPHETVKPWFCLQNTAKHVWLSLDKTTYYKVLIEALFSPRKKTAVYLFKIKIYRSLANIRPFTYKAIWCTRQ